MTGSDRGSLVAWRDRLERFYALSRRGKEGVVRTHATHRCGLDRIRPRDGITPFRGSLRRGNDRQNAAGAEGRRDTMREQTLRDGREIFRFDTFGDEQLWTDVLRMHEVMATVNPATALAVGLKVDVDALPTPVIAALRAGQVDLTNPAVTVELLRLNAVVGVKGTVDDAGQLTKVGVTCALCHSSVDDSFAPGIGKRLDGWANTDLNVGAIVALSPALDEATKAEFRTWGPGKYDPRHHAFDGTNIIPLNSPSLPIVIPSIYGLKGVGFETVHRRRPDFVLEQLRRRRTDGRPRQFQRSAHRAPS
jgi:hypothetical protein